jgi:glycosyltransferase involved in cell wall biosynthesis
VRDIGYQRDVPAALAAMNIFVLPSLWEGMPLTVLEAMRAGVAVVASDADGTAEVVRDGETGRLVPKADGPALTAAIRDLLDDPVARRRLAAAGAQFVTDRFDAESLARRTEALYRSSLGES